MSAEAGMGAAALVERIAEKHSTGDSAFRPALIAALKERMKAFRREAERRLLADGRGSRCAGLLAQGQDELIAALHALVLRSIYPVLNPSTGERMAVVATGGYGRGTLAPGSDIDLLFLLPYKQTAWGESVVEYLLYALWDLGFKVGHATRSVDECVRLARTDATIRTAMLETRFLCGDEGLFEELQRRYRKEVVGRDVKQFIAEKLAERDLRHARAGASRYLVEPDVKDGKGGLRDLHTLFWIAKYVYGSRNSQELMAAGVFTKPELQRFLKCEDFLWAVRCHLHFMTGRGDDRLSFDRQAELAERLGYSARGGLKHVERFMKHYFLTAKEVGDLTRIFCAVLEAQHIKKAPAIRRLFRTRTALGEKGGFRIDSGRINVTGETVFSDDPVNLLRLFGLAVRHSAPIHPDALKQVRRSLKLIGPELRGDPDANRIFLDILTESDDPEGSLRRMNEAGVLGRFIPDFGRIVALMQFNMYHHYTVDEHLLRAIGVLSDIEHGRCRDDHPLSSDIVLMLGNRRALYVAVLLHDIAKGRNERHAVAGERLAKSLGPRLGLAPAETELVAWLIRHHLLMSETAQMRDLNDYKTILDFAAVVQSPERLKLLLILTVCDIRAVGPGVWNGWKGQLLRTLYFETEPVLSGGHSSISRRDRVAQAQAAFRASLPDWDEARAARYMARHYEPYWLNSDTAHHRAHALLFEEAERTGEQIRTSVRTDEFTAITELTVLAPDHPRLLAMLTGACAAGGANIVGAQIFTTIEGTAIDTLLIQRAFAEEADEARRADRVAEFIGKALKGEARLKELVAAATRPKSRIASFSVEPRVIIDNESSNRLTVVEVNGLDRIGLLYELTEALFRLSLNIASAHIATFGERAVDVFYLTDLTGAKIADAHRRNAIIRSLTKILEPPEKPRGDVAAARGFARAEA